MGHAHGHHHARHSPDGAVSECGGLPPQNTLYMAPYGSLRTQEQIGTSCEKETQLCLTTYSGLFVYFEPGVSKSD